MDKYTIVALFGKSGVGKDTTLRMIKSIQSIQDKINIITPITTRPARDNGKDGTSYQFVSNEKFNEMIQNAELVEYTKFNSWQYGTKWDDLKANKINIGIFNLDSIHELLRKKDIKLFPIMIETEDKLRLIRTLNREDYPNCNEVCRRFLSDENDYHLKLNFSHITLLNNKGRDLINNRAFMDEFIKSTINENNI